MLDREFKVSCRWVDTAGAYIVSVGFLRESLGKWMSEWACSYLPEGRVVASCVGSEMHSSLPFDYSILCDLCMVCISLDQ